MLGLVVQQGHLLGLTGLDKTGPIETFVPPIAFAILFGLSMDYMVFIMSRIREEHVHGLDTRAAVEHGISAIGRVVVAAALIMGTVFAAFILSADRIPKEFGLLLAVAILTDALIVRMTLVPAFLTLMGEKSWYIPRWLDRMLPNITIEPPHDGEATLRPSRRRRPSRQAEPEPEPARPNELNGRQPAGLRESPRMRASTRMSLLAAAAVAALVLVPAALADAASEDALAQKYAPVVRLVDQPEECGPGEPFIPTDVDVLFDEPTVAFRGPWNRTDLVKIAPVATDLRNRYEHHLDFPGDPLDAGCDYELWARRLTAGTKPTVYAHVAKDPDYPGKVALQYWFFYPFNDFNNTHEGDWEMTQLVFDAANADEALDEGPHRGRVQLARGSRARRLGRREARDRRRHAPGRLPGRGLAREQVHGRALSRELRRGGRRLRPHARAASRGPSGREDDPARRDGSRGRLSRGSTSRAAGASCSRPSSTGRPART